MTKRGASLLRKPGGAASKPTVLRVKTVILALTGLLFILYAFLLTKLHSTTTAETATTGSQQAGPSSRAAANLRNYSDWKQVAMDLARLPPTSVLSELETRDPFGTRTFEKRLLERESQKQAILTIQEVKELFPCPPHDRITIPDVRNHARAKAFRSSLLLSSSDRAHTSNDWTFLFFQHLRKAGGTNFCTLARDNLPKRAVADYYCMSDYVWSRSDPQHKPGAGYLHHWTNEEIATNMKRAGHLITGNEWDTFDRLHHFDLPAIFATSFRKPMDRALSQFRFECIEDRGCKIKNVGTWWNKSKHLYNVYTVTFADVGRAGILPIFEGTTAKHQDQRAQLLGNALDTVVQFHLVLHMEWLAYAQSQVSSVLGFFNTSALTKRVRPHITSHKRNDHQEVNKLGAAGIQKASWDPQSYLSKSEYNEFAKYLALDEILTDAARRIFLERLVCNSE